MAKTAVVVFFFSLTSYVEALGQPVSPTPTEGCSQHIQPNHQTQHALESLWCKVNFRRPFVVSDRI